MKTIGIIIARAGSRGLAGKNMLLLGGRPLLAWTIEHARGCKRLSGIALTSDMTEALRSARRLGVDAYERPAELANDNATVDAAARHGASCWVQQHNEQPDAVAIMYANVPIRPRDITDRAIDLLEKTGADSVQSVYPVGKMHPYWMRTLGEDGQIGMYQNNRVYRRQDLPPLFMLDAGALVVRWSSLFTVKPSEPHAFLGKDRRGLETPAGSVVDVDTALDLKLAEAILAERRAKAADATHAA